MNERTCLYINPKMKFFVILKKLLVFLLIILIFAS